MIEKFINDNLKKAKFKKLADGTYFGQISGRPGVWANAKSLIACRRELAEVLEDWLLVKVQSREKIPGLNIRIGSRVCA